MEITVDKYCKNVYSIGRRFNRLNDNKIQHRGAAGFG
jgi:hypothetical protein